MKCNCQKSMLLLACRHSEACVFKITNTTASTVNQEGSEAKGTTFGEYKCPSFEFTSPKLLQNVWTCLNSGENWWAVSTNHTRWELPIIVAHACLDSKQRRTKRKQTLWLHKEISLKTSGSLFPFLPIFDFYSFGSVSPSLVPPQSLPRNAAHSSLCAHTEPSLRTHSLTFPKPILISQAIVMELFSWKPQRKSRGPMIGPRGAQTLH